MAKNKHDDTDELVEKLKEIMPMHAKDAAATLNISEQRANRLIRAHMPEHLNTPYRGIVSRFWGSDTENDRYI